MDIQHTQFERDLLSGYDRFVVQNAMQPVQPGWWQEALGGKKEKENSMDNEQQSEYRAHVRGAATFILLGQKNPPMDAPELVRLYRLDLATVTADIDAIVLRERHKVGGVFEVKPDDASAQLSKPTATARAAAGRLS